MPHLHTPVLHCCKRSSTSAAVRLPAVPLQGLHILHVKQNFELVPHRLVSVKLGRLGSCGVSTRHGTEQQHRVSSDMAGKRDQCCFAGAVVGEALSYCAPTCYSVMPLQPCHVASPRSRNLQHEVYPCTKKELAHPPFWCLHTAHSPRAT